MKKSLLIALGLTVSATCFGATVRVKNESGTTIYVQEGEKYGSNSVSIQNGDVKKVRLNAYFDGWNPALRLEYTNENNKTTSIKLPITKKIRIHCSQTQVTIG